MDDLKSNPAVDFVYTDDEIKEARAKLWEIGMLEWKLDATQKTLYDFYKTGKEKTTVINCSRRLGKSYFLIILAFEMALQKPKSIIKFLQPEVKMIRTNIRPIIDEITIDCPPEYAPEFRTQDNIYYFKNGSQIQLAGTDNGNYMKLRGGNSDLALIDEAGFCTELKHIIDYILIPTTTLTKGRIILSSTTPPDPAHEFVGYMSLAQSKNSFIKKTIEDAVHDNSHLPNPRITAEMVEEIVSSIDGGRDSESFRTEYMCEIIHNSDSAVVPEFDKEIEKDCVVEWHRPPFVDNYTSMDIGFRDMTFIIFGYYDFYNAVVVIEDELCIKGTEVTAERVDNLVRFKEDKYFTNSMSGEFVPPYKRVSDNNLIFLNDLLMTYNMQFFPTDKHNKDSYINKMRTFFQSRKIIINPRCVNLIAHLKNATWDKTRKEFKRSNGHHFDGVDALAYLIRNLDESRNPYPKNFKYSGLGNVDNVFYRESFYENKSDYKGLDKLNNQFSPKSSLKSFAKKNGDKEQEEMFSYFKKKPKK